MAQTNLTGGCHCGACRYQAQGQPLHHTLCHCTDCRRHAGAPIVGWVAFPQSAVTVTRGKPTVYHSSEHGRRHFCPTCGTGLFYYNEETLPGIMDLQTATLDDPEALTPDAHIQVAERIAWMTKLNTLPEFDRYPPQE